MKAMLILEDTPKGIKTKLIWQGNEVTDHPSQSVSLMLMANFAETVKELESKGLLYLEKEPGEKSFEKSY